MIQKIKSAIRAAWQMAVAVVFILLILALLPLILAGYYLWGVLLHILAWLVWNPRGIEFLYVYSNSPNWQEYIERNILPRLPPRAILLNWSERKQWKFSLATMMFWHFGGSREFNPMALIFRPFRWVKKYRFFKAFKDFKHGNSESLQKMEAEFFAILDKSQLGKPR